jgi:alkanesulfonate monooxygenase SsuD/methylene tetrahydromethanopterin reductase-like flavin-dependent oxidoreductase (luciferase family)
MVDRPFRFGVIAPKCGSGKELTEWARKAEALGFSALYVPDHFIDHDLAPTVALAHVAAVTDTLRVGPLVLGNDYKHPVALAREMATLDLLSEGRLELGLGSIGPACASPGWPSRSRSSRDCSRPDRSRSTASTTA